MKSHARVVVIGGGIGGCSTLYHLTREGDIGCGHADEVVGNITSAAWGFRMQKNLVMAYLKPEFATIDSRLEVALLGQRYTISVCERYST